MRKIDAITLYSMRERIRKLETTANNDDVKVKSSSSDSASKTREWLKVAISIPSVLAVIIASYIQLDNFFDLKEKELHFNLSKEIIELNKQINSGQVELVRDAIYLLGSLGPDAAFLLVYHLDDVNVDETVEASISFALNRIIETSRKTGNQSGVSQVINLLAQRTIEVISKQLQEGIPSVKRINRHISALAEAFKAVGCSDTKKEFNNTITGFLSKAEDLPTFSDKGTLVEILRDAKSTTNCD
jgi:hypothetical protein